MSFFVLVLLQKRIKLRFINHEVIYELVEVMNQSRVHWNVSSIFVTGSTDLTGFLLLQGQRVERINAIYKKPAPRWQDTYDNFIELINVRIPEDHTSNPSALFWSGWKKVSSYQSKNEQFILSIYESPRKRQHRSN